MARRHRGAEFDPALVDLFCAHAPPRCSTASTQAAEWDAILDAEPEP